VVAPGEPALQRLPRGEVKAWPVRVGSAAGIHARKGVWWSLQVLLTGGLYLPWAFTAARRALWRHTRVAGLSMDDHQPAAAQLLHWLLMLGLAGGVALAWRSGPGLGLVAASLAVLAWPVLVFLQARRRAHHLSWARRRMGFEGRCAQVYREVWPLVAGALVVMWGLAAAARWGRPEGWCVWGLVSAGWAMALPLAAWGWLDWRQRHLRLGPWSLWWSVPREGLVSVFWRTVVWASLAGLFMAGLTTVVWSLLRWCQVPLGWWGHLALLAVPVYLVYVAARAYVQARLQNLVWGKTGNRVVRLQSRLNVADYVQQQCGHAVLMLCTLGLYWPWAQLATHRMRLQAVTVWSRVEADALRANWPVSATDVRSP